MASSFLRRGSFGSPAIFPGWPFITFGTREKHRPRKDWCDRLALAGGRNLYGEPIFKPEFGWNVTRIGTIPKYHVNLNEWLLLRWVAPSVQRFGTHEDWYARRWVDGELVSAAERFREEWPYRGDYIVHSSLPEGVPFDIEGAERAVRLYVNRGKLPSSDQRLRDDWRTAEDAKDRAADEDYEKFSDATPAFAGEAFVGYGQKSADEPAAPAPSRPITPSALRQIQTLAATRAARSERQQGAA